MADRLKIQLLLPQVRIDGAYIIGRNLCQDVTHFPTQTASEMDEAVDVATFQRSRVVFGSKVKDVPEV